MSPDGDADILALERALDWRAAPSPPWKSIAGSLVMHALAIAICISVFAGPLAEVVAPTARGVSGYPFVPLAYYAPPAPKQVVVAGGHPAASAIELPEATTTKATVNLSSIRLSIAPDVRNQLPAVVEAQHGMLALLDKDDLEIARYLMEPPEWKPRATMQNMSRSLRFKMEPAGKWPVFREIAERYGIDLDRYVGCAVFDASFGQCLKAAIQSRLAPDADGAVSSARLAFASDRACGIEVLEVGFADRPAKSAMGRVVPRRHTGEELR